MSKVGGSYESVVRGVSQQVAQDRRPGQHEEQINMISDPVRGLARRWGTEWQSELALGAKTSAVQAIIKAEGAAMREFTFTVSGKEYCLLYRTKPSAQGSQTFAYCYNKDDNVFVPIVYQSGSGWLGNLFGGGVSAIANVGRYIYLAGNSNIPTYSITNSWGVTGSDNQNRGVIWVRTGAYSRTYSVTVWVNGTAYTVAYKTKPSAYPVLLDTSDIQFYLTGGTTPDPLYQKNINDRTYAYNSAVTKYIGDAAADITPENIARQLYTLLLPILGVGVGLKGSTVYIQTANLTDISTDDGGDNSSMLAVANEVDNIDKLSSQHFVGKIVRIRPQGAQAKEAYYVRADSKNGSSGTGTQTEVIWREAAGVTQTPVNMFAMGVIQAGTLYIGQDPAGLKILTGDSTHPDFKPNVVGDAASCPIPNFYGRKITMMTVFQDRLVIGSEGTVSCSRPGDYLNFYRNTVLNVQDDDPVEMFSYGAEGDILRYSAMFDRDLVIFGDQKQYAISGRSVLTPKAPNIAVMSAHEYTTQAPPQSSGNLVFYGKQREGRTSLHQLQVGQLTESPESYEVSNALDTYLQGMPAQIITLTSPNTVVYRTEQVNSNLYVYNYMDTPAGQERLFDSWCTWKYADTLGTVVGASSNKGELLVFTLRVDPASTRTYIVADRQSLSTELSSKPYMDSMRPQTTIPGAGWHKDISVSSPVSMDVAIDNTHVSFLFGDSWDQLANLVAQIPDAAAHAWVGCTPPAFVTPTNPFFRDSNGKAIIEGRLTMTHVALSLANTAGVEVEVSTLNGSRTSSDFIGRTMGSTDNLIGSQPIITDKLIVGIGAETRECSYTIRAQAWLPLTITAIGWTGQYFNRVRRAG